MLALGPINVGIGRTVVQVAAGAAHTCAVLDNGTLKCFGGNSLGQLGLDSTLSVGATSANEVADLAPADLGTDRTVKQVACGNVHTCVILDNDELKCFGRGDFGQLGTGNTANAGAGGTSILMTDLPTVNLGTDRTAKQVSAGTVHTCVVLDDGTLECFGRNSQGQLGYDSTTSIGTTASSMTSLGAVNVGTDRTVVQVACGGVHTCALLDNGSVKCWGQNGNGQLGTGNTTLLGDGPGEMAMLQPVNLGAGRTAKWVAAGNGHSCVILDDDSVVCWGSNFAGQLGQDSNTNLGDNPGEMESLSSIIL